MKKAIFFLAITICSVFQSIGQKVFNAKFGYSSLENKGVVGNTTLRTQNIFSVIGFQQDGPKTLSLSYGPRITRKSDETKIYFLPGIVADWGRSKLHYSASLVFEREDTCLRSEAIFIIKAIMNLDKEKYTKWIAGGEFLFGNILKFGPYLEGEYQREIGIDLEKPFDAEAVFSDISLSFGIKSIWHPAVLKNFSIQAFSGVENINETSRLVTTSYTHRYPAEYKFAGGLSLGYVF